LLDGGLVVIALSGKPTDGTRTGKRTLKYCYCCGVQYVDQSGVRSVDWFLWLPCMFYYFREGREEVKGDESYHVAIRVEVEPMLG